MQQRLQILRGLTLQVALGALVGALCGVASAAFLWLLDEVTTLRGQHTWLPWTLPVIGVLIGVVYLRWGRPVQRGTGLVIDTLHDGGPPLPLRMAPMVLAGTLATHLGGGSAGREGTAVQMGASLADQLARLLGIKVLRPVLISAGVAGGFGSVFGTPVAGIVFALELAVIGRMEARGLLALVVAALVGDQVTRALGIVHTPYPAVLAPAFTPLLVGKLCALALAVALVAVVFIELTHAIRRVLERQVPLAPLRLALGGLAVVLLWRVTGDDYLGLGVPTIVRAFHDPSLPPWAFAAKLGLTALTIGSGFIGGEVTPLFFIGATLGAAAAHVLGLPLPLAAALGMAALFGAAANTPLALAIMAVELCGASLLPHVVLVTCVAWALTGARGIYAAQRVAHDKHVAHDGPAPAGPLRSLDEARRG